MLLILTCITIERRDNCDPFRGGALERIDHDQLFHDLLIERCGVGLDDEGIASSNALFEPYEDLAIGEVICRGGGDGNAEFLGDLICEFRISASSEES